MNKDMADLGGGINLIANPMIIFREELDDWAILFDPDANETYGLNPVSAFIWKLLDGKHTPEMILTKLKNECEGGVPSEASGHLADFLNELQRRGLAGIKC